MEFLDREGKLIAAEVWSRLHKDRKYKFVVETKVLGGEIVSSWLGRDASCSHYSDGAGRALIFGTILRMDDGEWGRESFSATLTQCLAEHKARVESAGSLG